MSLLQKLFATLSKPFTNAKSLTIREYLLHDRKSDIQDNYQAFSEGYLRNVIVYRCVDLLASSASALPIELASIDSQGKLIFPKKHPLIDLLKRPNPTLTQRDFLKQVLINYLVTGEAYVHKNTGATSKKILEVEVFPSHQMSYQTSTNDRYPLLYRYNPEYGPQQVFPVDQISGKSDILHLKKYNPLCRFDGLSSLQPASAAIDNHNAGLEWNASLLENSARPSGTYYQKGSVLSADQEQWLEELKHEKHAGAKNAGKVEILQGDLTWQQTSLSPMDMDFKSSIEVAAMNIGAAFNIPYQLIIKGDSTYNNYATAREELYTNAVIPLLEGLLQELSLFLDPSSTFFFTINDEKIDALEPKREREANRWKDRIQTGINTINEAREALGYDPFPVDEANTPLIPRSFMPLDDIALDQALANMQPGNPA